MYRLLIIFLVLLVLLILLLKNNKNIENFQSQQKNITYDNVNSFRLNSLKILFFDIFARNNELILIAPVYCDLDIDYDKVDIKYQNKKLKLKKKLEFIEWEPTIISIYDLTEFNLEDNTHLDIEVSYKNHTKKFNLEYKILKKKIQFGIIHSF